eukprot:COSAG01_NODE_2170_length_8236_cov_17.597272_1_plen_93_part_10
MAAAAAAAVLCPPVGTPLAVRLHQPCRQPAIPRAGSHTVIAAVCFVRRGRALAPQQRLGAPPPIAAVPAPCPPPRAPAGWPVIISSSVRASRR